MTHDAHPKAGTTDRPAMPREDLNKALAKQLRALVIMDEVGSDNPLGRQAAEVMQDLNKALELSEHRLREAREVLADAMRMIKLYAPQGFENSARFRRAASFLDSLGGEDEGSSISQSGSASKSAPSDWEPSGLRVVSAACRYGPLILSMPPPARHHTIMHAIYLLGGEAMVRLGDQGFLLSDGTFAQRKPALIIATEAKQLVKNPNAQSSPISPPSLFSEDMW